MTVNDYEASMLVQVTGWSHAEIASRVTALILTLGEFGAKIYTISGNIDIPSVKGGRIIDPTGCGDAFRAGLIYGLTNGKDLATSAKPGSLMGSIKIAHQGPQTHALTADEIPARFPQEFGYSYRQAAHPCSCVFLNALS